MGVHTLIPELRQKQVQISVGDQFRSGEHRIQVEPLMAEFSNREPVLAEIANIRRLSAKLDKFIFYRKPKQNKIE